MSCGPFHTCAISSTGRLFSWGDGLCGKLGHGDSATCYEPRQVLALVKQAVLHVACGFWHTACVARPHQPGQEDLGAANYLSGSVDASAESNPEGEHNLPLSGSPPLSSPVFLSVASSALVSLTP